MFWVKALHNAGIDKIAFFPHQLLHGVDKASVIKCAVDENHSVMAISLR